MNFDSLQQRLKDISFELYLINDSIEGLNNQFEEILKELSDTPNTKTKKPFKKNKIKNTRNKKAKLTKNKRRNTKKLIKKGGWKNENTKRKHNTKKNQRK